MMQVHNSRERDLDEWVALLKGRDEMLRLQNVVQPFGSSMSILEVVRDDTLRTDGYTNGAVNEKADITVVGEVPPIAALPGAAAT